MTTLPIPTGWVQYSQTYSDKSTCESFIKHNQKQIIMDISSYMGRDPKTGELRFKGAKEFECTTYEEAVKRNTELGH